MREAAARQGWQSGRQTRFSAVLLASLVLAALGLACSPEGGGALRPSLGSGSGSSGSGGGPASLLPQGGGGSDGPEAGARAARPLLLEPIVEKRSSGAGRALGEEDLRSLGELSILPHVVQSISSGAPCDFKDAMSNCQ